MLEVLLKACKSQNEVGGVCTSWASPRRVLAEVHTTGARLSQVNTSLLTISEALAAPVTLSVPAHCEGRDVH